MPGFAFGKPGGDDSCGVGGTRRCHREEDPHAAGVARGGQRRVDLRGQALHRAFETQLDRDPFGGDDAQRLGELCGLGFSDGEVWLSAKFAVTMLREDGCMDNSWFSTLDWEGSTFHGEYRSFKGDTGVELEPGEYTTIEVKEV